MPTATMISGLIERARSAIRGLHVFFRFRIGDLVIKLRQGIEHVLGAIDDPDRLAAPLDGHHLTRLELGDVDLDRRTGGLGSLRWQHAGHERHERCDRADPQRLQSETTRRRRPQSTFSLIARQR